MKKIYALSVLLLSAVYSNAQVFDPCGIGLRLSPDGLGLTGKFFIDPHFVLESQVNVSGGFSFDHTMNRGGDFKKVVNTSAGGRSWTVGGLIEYNIIFHNKSWRVFGGGGFHFGKWDRFSYKSSGQNERPKGVFGIDGIMGVEYVFKSLPLGISADVKPAVNFSKDVAFFPNNIFGASVRYYFGHMVKMYY